MAAASTVLAGIGAASSLYSGYTQSNAMREQGDYQRDQFNKNAGFADAQAADAEVRGQQQASQIGAEAQRTVGTQKTAYASQGVDSSVGSAAEVGAATGELAAQDIRTAKVNAWREAMGYKVQAEDLRSQGSMAKSASEKGANATLIGSGLRAFDYVKDLVPSGKKSTDTKDTKKKEDVKVTHKTIETLPYKG